MDQTRSAWPLSEVMDDMARASAKVGQAMAKAARQMHLALTREEPDPYMTALHHDSFGDLLRTLPRIVGYQYRKGAGRLRRESRFSGGRVVYR